MSKSGEFRWARRGTSGPGPPELVDYAYSAKARYQKNDHPYFNLIWNSCAIYHGVRRGNGPLYFNIWNSRAIYQDNGPLNFNFY